MSVFREHMDRTLEYIEFLTESLEHNKLHVRLYENRLANRILTREHRRRLEQRLKYSRKVVSSMENTINAEGEWVERHVEYIN